MRIPAIGRAAGTDRGRNCVLAAAGLSGAVLLRRSLSAKADSRRFYALTAGLAGTWTASALLTTAVPVWPASRTSLGRKVARPALTGAATFALFYAAAAVARRDPFLRRAIVSVLHYVDEGTTPAVLFTASVNAAAEELFFRGALWDAISSDPLASTTLAYTAVTAATGNLALAIGAAITGVIFGRERARSGGVAAPAIAHITWSALMLTGLPPLFRSPPEP
ncbi:MAG TPA: CPBP family intramembrane glutamic endopeptidase [Streptosporangiaceae bacterium]|nr:CPBP family intramembrane glutamic endopeptidase [Streptosporangiaceae bacterium]